MSDTEYDIARDRAMTKAALHGDRCEDGRLMRHKPSWDDPYGEVDVGECPFCDGNGCDDEADGEPQS